MFRSEDPEYRVFDGRAPERRWNGHPYVGGLPTHPSSFDYVYADFGRPLPVSSDLRGGVSGSGVTGSSRVRYRLTRGTWQSLMAEQRSFVASGGRVKLAPRSEPIESFRVGFVSALEVARLSKLECDGVMASCFGPDRDARLEEVAARGGLRVFVDGRLVCDHRRGGY